MGIDMLLEYIGVVSARTSCLMWYIANLVVDSYDKKFAMSLQGCIVQ